jgi:hypothetical protein
MQRIHQHRGFDLPPWAESLLGWIVIALVVGLNVLMMWRIATATV